MVFTNIIISSKKKKFLCLNQCLFTKFIVRTIKEYFLLEDLKKDYIFLTKVKKSLAFLCGILKDLN